LGVVALLLPLGAISTSFLKISNINVANLEEVSANKAHFTLGVTADVEPKSSIPIGAKVEISPQGLYTKSQV
jgi:hypothetical protein